jgi:hypothetical protein
LSFANTADMTKANAGTYLIALIISPGTDLLPCRPRLRAEEVKKSSLQRPILSPPHNHERTPQP